MINQMFPYFGSKVNHLEFLLDKVPKNFNWYIEPFVGSGAMWLALRPVKSLLGDLNEDIVNLYNCLINKRSEVQSLYRKLKNDETSFHQTKTEYNLNRLKWPETERAAVLLYLIKSCYNGILNYRDGQIFSTFGYHKNIRVKWADYKLPPAIIHCRPAEELIAVGEKNDFIFLDPPYLDCYNSYKNSWSLEQDRDLSWQVRNSRAKVMLIVEDRPFIRKLYEGLKIEPVKVKTRLGVIDEILIRNYDA